MTPPPPRARLFDLPLDLLKLPDVAALLSRRLELREACVIAAGEASRARAFYGVGITDFEAEPFDASRLNARLEAAVRLKTQQIELLHGVVDGGGDRIEVSMRKAYDCGA